MNGHKKRLLLEAACRDDLRKTAKRLLNKYQGESLTWRRSSIILKNKSQKNQGMEDEDKDKGDTSNESIEISAAQQINDKVNVDTEKAIVQKCDYGQRDKKR